MIETCRPAPIPEDVARAAVVPAALLVECPRLAHCSTLSDRADFDLNVAEETFDRHTVESSTSNASNSGKFDCVESTTSTPSQPVQVGLPSSLTEFKSTANPRDTALSGRVDKSIVTPDAPCRICKSTHRPPLRQNESSSGERHLDPSDDGSNTKRRRNISTVRRKICSTYTLWKLDQLKRRCVQTSPHHTKANSLGQALTKGSCREEALNIAASRSDVSASRDIALRWESRHGSPLIFALTNALPMWTHASSTKQIGGPPPCKDPLLSLAAAAQRGETASRLQPAVGVANEQSATKQSAAATERMTSSSCAVGDLWTHPTTGGETARSCFVSHRRRWRGVELAKSSKLFKKRRWSKVTSPRWRGRPMVLRQLHCSTNFETDQQSSRISPHTYSSINSPSSSCVNVVLSFKLISNTSVCKDAVHLPSSSRVSIFLPLRCNKIRFWSCYKKRPPSLSLPSFPLYNKCSYYHCRWRHTRSLTSSRLQSPPPEQSLASDRAPSLPHHCGNSLPSNPSHRSSEDCRSLTQQLSENTCRSQPRRAQCDALGSGDAVSWTLVFLRLVSNPILLLLHFVDQNFRRLLSKRGFPGRGNIRATTQSTTTLNQRDIPDSTESKAFELSVPGSKSGPGVLVSSNASANPSSKSPATLHHASKCTTRQKRIPFLRSWLWFLLVVAVILPYNVGAVFHPNPMRFVRSAATHAENYNASIRPRGPICQSTDVRNSVVNLNFLNGCRVIEGFLQIFVEGDSPEAWGNHTFPDLVEVTDYVLLYRNTGLRSLGHLFPNLTVIRGRNLLHNYALVVYENLGLQELDLFSLTDILRGSVLVMKNPTLCFVDTVDWDLISQSKGGHYIKDNRHPNECPMCPLNNTGGEMCSGGTPGSKPLCVSATQCQKICRVECTGAEGQQGRPACYNQGRTCCNQECIGGCTGNTSTHCAVCRHFDYYGTCVEKCPGHLFNYLDRRCVSNDECQAQPPPLTPTETPPKHWKFVRNELTGINVCVLDCPKDYEEKEVYPSRFECHRCVGACERSCEGGNIESIQKLQSYRDCTHIKGSLEIQIQNGANVVKELEDNLGMVEEIEGYLKIARSYPVMSLNFFKKLRVIRGRDLETNKFALVVLDNQNLMELWDWDKRDKNLVIETGRMFFHFNPKLCYDHIERLANVTNFTDGPTDTEAPKSSNGDKAACNITPIKATATAHRWGTIISWERFNHYDPRALLSYLIFYKETKDQNVTIYDGRDACGGDGWKMEDVENKDANVPMNLTAEPTSDVYNGNQVDTHVTQILTSLKPFTQYAYYVRTYTIATERSGAQSPIQYFITLPSTPSVPRELSAKPLSSSELEISWKPPQTPNGNVTHYYIVGVWEKDDPALLVQRNYCNKQTTPSPVLPGESTTVQPSSQTKTTITPSNKPANDTSGGGKPQLSGQDDEECECNKKNTNSEDAKQKENNRQIEIDFENALQNVVYVKRTPVVESQYGGDEGFNRRRREVGGAEPVFPSHNVVGGAENVFPSHNVTVGESNKTNQFIIVPSPEGNKTSSEGVFERFEFVVYGATSFTVRNLSHYAKYNIDVQACRQTVPNESFDVGNSNCSTRSMVTRRTMHKDGVDTIDSVKFKVEFVNSSWVAEWEAPPTPNGLILAYKVDIVRQDKAKYASAHEPCISKLDYDREKRYEIPLDVIPSPGNYSIRVRVISLAGDGPWSDRLYFVVQKETLSTTEWIFICLLVLLIVVLISLLVIYYRRERRPTMNPSVNPEYIPVYKKDSWEVLRSRVTILDELGNGSFGLVCKGIIKDFRSVAEHPCAIKLVNEHATDRERAEFLNEASVMKAFDTHHVVKLYGVVSEGHPTLVIMELMAGGDLKNYLRSCRPDADVETDRSPPTLKQILQMAAEIADGMAYLADKKYVHRDLAARNCMVADDLTVKVGDFGMTRDIYETEYYRKGSRGFLPVRWMAPESLKDGVFTSCSDVWSYGVVLWEIATLASQPYQGLANEQVLNWVKGGGILVRPDNCPDRLFSLMRRCWQFKPQARPTFMQLLADLEPDTQASFPSVSYYHSDAAKEHKIRMASKADTRTSSTTLDEAVPLRFACDDIEDFSLGSEDEENDSEGECSHPGAGTRGLNMASQARDHHEDNRRSRNDSETTPLNAGGKTGGGDYSGDEEEEEGEEEEVRTTAAARHRYLEPVQDPHGRRHPTTGSSLPDSKNSTMGRLSEDSAAYLDTSRASTLGRSPPLELTKPRPTGNSSGESSHPDKAGPGVGEGEGSQSPHHHIVHLTNERDSSPHSTPLSPPGNKPESNYTSLAGRSTPSSAATVPRVGGASSVAGAGLPSYLGGRFSTLGNRITGHNAGPQTSLGTTGLGSLRGGDSIPPANGHVGGSATRRNGTTPAPPHPASSMSC